MKIVPLLVTLLLSSSVFADGGPFDRGTLVYKKEFLEVKNAHEKTMQGLDQRVTANSSSLSTQDQRLNVHDRWLDEHANTLYAHLETLKAHGKELDRHSGVLAGHEELLKSHSATLKDHSDQLGKHSQVLDQHGQMISKAQSDIRAHDGRISTAEANIQNQGNQIQSVKAKTAQMQQTQRGVAEVLAAENAALKASISAIESALAQANIPVEKEPEDQARARVTQVLQSLLEGLKLESTNIKPEDLTISEIEGLNAFMTVCLSNSKVKDGVRTLTVSNDPAAGVFDLKGESNLTLNINLAFPSRRLIPASVECANSR